MQRFSGVQISHNTSNISSSTGVRSHGGGVLSVGGKKIKAHQYAGKSMEHITRDLKAKGLDAGERRKIVSVLSGGNSDKGLKASADNYAKLSSVAMSKIKGTVEELAKAALHDNQNKRYKEAAMGKIIEKFSDNGKGLSREDGKKLIVRAEKLKERKIRTMLHGNMATDSAAVADLSAKAKAYNKNSKSAAANDKGKSTGHNVNVSAPLMGGSMMAGIGQTAPRASDSYYSADSQGLKGAAVARSADSYHEDKKVEPDLSSNQGMVDYF